MSKPCMQDGCTDARVDDGTTRFDFCSRHLSEPRRCAKTRTKDGKVQRCKNPARRGLRFCSTHAGRKDRQDAKVAKAKALTDMQRFVKPYDGDVDPVSVFEAEFRRTLGRIKWYDEQLARLASAEDLIWGLTKEEQIMASETPGSNKTYEARVNMIEQLQFKERRHLLDMEKVWITAKLDERKLNLMKRYVETSYVAMIETLTRLGLDPADKKVRDVLADVLLGEGARHVEAEVEVLELDPPDAP